MASYFQRFTTIVNKWLGHDSDYDRNHSIQCVDWAREYCAAQGTPIGTFGGSAINCWNTGCAFDKSWKRIYNAKNVVPAAGDVIFFQTGKYGHVAIADVGSTSTELRVIEQNGQTGDGKGIGGDAIRRKTYNYIYPKCVGWFTRM